MNTIVVDPIDSHWAKGIKSHVERHFGPIDASLLQPASESLGNVQTSRGCRGRTGHPRIDRLVSFGVIQFASNIWWQWRHAEALQIIVCVFAKLNAHLALVEPLEHGDAREPTVRRHFQFAS